MKTAISVPDDVFAEAEKFARKTGKTRSQLYSEAVRQYLLRNSPKAITEAMNAVCDKVDQSEDEQFIRQAGRKILRRERW